MASTYATSPLAPLPSLPPGGGAWEALIVGTPQPIWDELYFPLEKAEWEGRRGQRRGGLGRWEQLPFRIPWVAVPTHLATVNPLGLESVLFGYLVVGAPLFLWMDIYELQMVSCGLRPRFLASWHLDILPLCVGSLAISWLHERRNSAPPPPRLFVRQILSLEEGKGGSIIIFACIDHFYLGLLTQPASSPTPHMHRLRNQFFGHFLGSFIDCQGKEKQKINL